ncbi:hypothetical protein KP77_02980 [Jeotgalibacillus alimentarius]|uniref:Uncharacterized protein n=1 Tax=Jeotgalibacillus alimentarius TaxID=135826 RepID=A0A0C2VWS0_9BACL|nr:type II secretion system protein [Jeotgalibacillus alimentarius]KIL53322.1 hypothetical protein KP77_02980 [Jeotgalibacillus alimentarius]
MKNESGYTLLTVMLIVLVFTTLGAVLLTVTVGSTQRTELREDTIVEDSDAIRAIEQGTAILKYQIQNNEFSSPGSIYQGELDNVISSLTAEGLNISIADKSTDYDINLSNDYTRVYEIRSTGYNDDYAKLVYVTAMPSFLKYAAGARDELSLHGGMYIDGDIYANNQLNISNEAKYIFEGSLNTVKNDFPTVSERSSLILEDTGIATSCDHQSVPGCFDVNAGMFSRSVHWQQRSLEDLLAGSFSYQSPVQGEVTDYIDVRLIPTVTTKMKELDPAFDDADTEAVAAGGSVLTVRGYPDAEQYENALSSDTVLHEENVITSLQPDRNHLYISDAFLNTSTLSVNPDKWVVVMGDLVLESAAGETADISSNMIVFGDVILRGDLAMDSVVYALGNTTVFNANIKRPAGGGELILMSRGKLDIALLNSFSNPADFTEFPNQLNAFLYTDKNAEIYSVGSYVYIDGGVFSKGSLEFNSFRGDTAEGADDIIFTATNEDSEAFEKSRLYVRNNQRLFLDKLQALPAVERLDVIEDAFRKVSSNE